MQTLPRRSTLSQALLVLILCLWPGCALMSQSVTLAWDASSGPGVAGYLVHSEEVNGSDTAIIDAGANVTTVVSGLVSGKTYRFTVTAYTSSGLESDPSNAITYTVGVSGEASFLTGKVLGTLRNSLTAWVGMKFKVGANPLTVTSLGRIFASGNTRSHIVKLVRASDGTAVLNGSVLVSMAGGTPGQFKYGVLPAPVTLSANREYYLLSLELQGGDGWYNSDTMVTTANVASCQGSVYDETGANPKEVFSPGKVYGPLNFKYLKSSNASVSTSEPILLDFSAARLFIDTTAFGDAYDSDPGFAALEVRKMQITLAGVPSWTYVIESSATLTNWSAIRRIRLSNPTFRFEVANEPGPIQKFYRSFMVTE